MGKEIKTLQAALNLNDPDQLLMYKYVKTRSNASDYIKRLIWLDMKGTSSNEQRVEIGIEIREEKVEIDEDLVDEDLMSGFI